jgi:hypothetical protein
MLNDSGALGWGRWELFRRVTCWKFTSNLNSDRQLNIKCCIKLFNRDTLSLLSLAKGYTSIFSAWSELIETFCAIIFVWFFKDFIRWKPDRAKVLLLELVYSYYTANYYRLEQNASTKPSFTENEARMYPSRPPKRVVTGVLWLAERDYANWIW